MTQTKTRLTFEEYANLDAEAWLRLGLPEGRCEYVNEWELNELPSESELNDWIALFLRDELVQFTNRRLVRLGTCEIEVPGKPKTRYPDLVILREEHIALTQSRLLIKLDMPPPQFVAEVVSPNQKNRQRDYEAKRSQYEARGIPEYWLIDPQQQMVTVLSLVSDRYAEVGTFRGSDQIQSRQFEQLNLTADQILTIEE
jgi:Uma2 family endonuclease